MSNLRRSPT